MPQTVQRVVDRWPSLAGQLRAALAAAEEHVLASQVDALVIVEQCDCGDDFCQSFSTAPRTQGPYGAGHRNVDLDPPWRGMLVLDVVDGHIVYVEVLDRDALE